MSLLTPNETNAYAGIKDDPDTYMALMKSNEQEAIYMGKWHFFVQNV